jgi:hypothetical protein
MSAKKSASLDPIPPLKEALETFQRNVNGHNEFDRAAVGTIRVQLPQLIREVERLRAEPAQSYAVVIHDPDEDSIVETQGPVKVFYVDLGDDIDISNPMEEDALSALRQAIEYAQEVDKLPEGVVKDTLEGAVEQLVDNYGQFSNVVEALSAEDKTALADWLPEAVGVA